jgi:hypothetical protein
MLGSWFSPKNAKAGVRVARARCRNGINAASPNPVSVTQCLKVGGHLAANRYAALSRRWPDRCTPFGLPLNSNVAAVRGERRL